MFIKGRDMTGEAAVIIDGGPARSENASIISVKPLVILHPANLKSECSSTWARGKKYMWYGNNRLGSWKSAALISRKGWVTQSTIKLIGTA